MPVAGRKPDDPEKTAKELIGLLKPDQTVALFCEDRRVATALHYGGFCTLWRKRQPNIVELTRLVRTCEHFDLVYIQTVPGGEQTREYLWTLGHLSQNVIVPEEIHIDRLVLDRVFDSVIEAFDGHFLCQNHSITRQRCMSYAESKTGHRHVVEYRDAQWFIDNKPAYIKGYNLETRKFFDTREPTLTEIFEAAGRAYRAVIEHEEGWVTDIHPRNVMVTNSGVKVIDWTEGVGDDIYGLTWDEYVAETKSHTAESLTRLLASLYFEDKG